MFDTCTNVCLRRTSDILIAWDDVLYASCALVHLFIYRILFMPVDRIDCNFYFLINQQSIIVEVILIDKQ